jgi:hypothetical protein
MGLGNDMLLGWWLCVVMLGLLFISGFAGLLPVVSCVFGVNSLIINGIRFCWLWFV